MALTMIRKLTTVLLLSTAVGLMPLGATAHEGHDHGVKAKKVKKSKPKKAAVETRSNPVAGIAPIPLASRGPAVSTKYAIVSIGLTTC